MLVKFKPTGQLGNIPDNEYDPSIYEPASGGSTPQAQAPQMTQQTTTQPQTPFTPPAQPEDSMITKVGNAGISALKTMFSAPTRFGKGIGNAIDATTQSANQDVITKNAMANSDALRNAAIRASQSGDKAKATKLFEMSRKALGPIQKVALGTEKNLATGQEDLTKGAVGTGSFFIPGGNTPLGRIGSNMVAGGMQGYGNSKTGNEVADTMGGAATAGVISGGLEATGATYNLAKKGLGKLGDMTANRAAQGINKATPTMFNNAVEQHGIDLGKLTQKYVPPGSSYDDLIGGISDRGNGGSFNEILNKAEDQIQSTSKAAGTNVKISGDDLIAALKQEAAKMKGQLGGGAREEALNEIIKQAESKYSKGMTVSQGIKTLRYANNKFGKNIVDVAPSDAVANAAQKLEANVMRTTLKTMFPDLANALDTQSEILTLRPLINRARSIANTQGSQIRVGAFKSLTDLINPFAYTDAVMNTPQLASRFLGKGGLGANPAAAKISQNILPKVASSTAIGLLNNGDNQTYNKQDTVDQTNSQNHDTSITDQGLGAKPPTLNQYGASPEVIYREYQNATNAGDTKTAARLRTMYEDEVAYQKTNKTAEPKKTEKQQMFANSAVAAKQALNLLNTNNVSTGLGQKQLGKIGEVFGTNSSDQQKYRSSLAIARTTVRSALLGSQMSPGEMESIAAFIPEFDDAPSTAKSKLNTFIELMNTFGKNLEGTAPDYSGLGANPQQAMQ